MTDISPAYVFTLMSLYIGSLYPAHCRITTYDFSIVKDQVVIQDE